MFSSVRFLTLFRRRLDIFLNVYFFKINHLKIPESVALAMHFIAIIYFCFFYIPIKFEYFQLLIPVLFSFVKYPYRLETDKQGDKMKQYKI